jgi:hypothetical protein
MKMLHVLKTIIFSSLLSLFILLLCDTLLFGACCLKKRDHKDLKKLRVETTSESSISVASNGVMMTPTLLSLLRQKLVKMLEEKPEHFERLVATCRSETRDKRISSAVISSTEKAGISFMLGISTGKDGSLIRLINGETGVMNPDFKKVILGFAEKKQDKKSGKISYSIRSMKEFHDKMHAPDSPVLEMVS